MSRGETSAAVLDCMNAGLATIVNANGSMNDLCDDSVLKIQDDFTQEELINALENLYVNPNKRNDIGENAKSNINIQHSPKKCARQYFETIERFYSTIVDENTKLLPSIVRNEIDNSDLLLLADCISKNHPYNGEKVIFVDVSS